MVSDEDTAFASGAVCSQLVVPRTIEPGSMGWDSEYFTSAFDRHSAGETHGEAQSTDNDD